MPKKGDKEYIFTDKDYLLIEKMSAIRIPVEDMRYIIAPEGRTMAKSTWNELVKKDEKFGEAVKSGRAKASHNIRSRGYDKAMKGDFKWFKYWCDTQEGFKSTSVHEMTGKDGAPLTPRTLEEAELALADLRKKTDISGGI